MTLQPTTTAFLALLLGSDEEDVHLCLSGLHSILDIPPPKRNGSEIRTTHASVRDFFVDKLRSGKYYLDEEAFHTNIALQCVRQISALSVNTAGHYRRDWQWYSGNVSKPFSSREEYLISGFIYHCTRASTDSTDLKNALMQIRDLRWLFEIWSPFEQKDFQVLFAWLSKADTAPGKLLRHIQSLWDRYLINQLNKCSFNENNVDIAGLLFFPTEWQLRWISHISGPSRDQVPEIFIRVIWTKSEDHDGDTTGFHLFLTEFFEDRNRSGKYHLEGIVYAHAALECLQNMVNPNDDEIFNPYPFIIMGIERPDAKSFLYLTEDIMSERETFVPGYHGGLEAVSKILLKAAPLPDLYFYLQDHPLQNPAKTKVHWEHGFGSLRLAVKDYLDKCKHLNPRVLRRSTSLPNMDMGLGFWEPWMSFNERWPLRADSTRLFGRQGGFYFSESEFERQLAVQRMRELPEMKVLRSRNKIAHGGGEWGTDSA